MFTLSQPLKSTRYRIVAGALAVLVMLLTFASVSPKLHEKLHAVDAGCSHHSDHHSSDHSDDPVEADSHYCGVTLLTSGIVFATPPQLPQAGDLQFASLLIRSEKVWVQQTTSPQSARGPPTLIVV